MCTNKYLISTDSNKLKIIESITLTNNRYASIINTFRIFFSETGLVCNFIEIKYKHINLS